MNREQASGALNRCDGPNWADRSVQALVLLLVLFSSASYARAQDSIAWLKDLKQGSELAQKTNRPMLVDFWADWCGPCKIMDQEIYKNPAVIRAMNEKVVAVRLNFDMQQDAARRYKVEALPHLVFANSYGTELLHHHGVLEAEDLTAVLQALPSDLSDINRLDRILREDKDDMRALLGMGERLTSSGFFESANTYFQRALKEKQSNTGAAQREKILFTLGSNWLQLQDGKDAAETLERYRNEFSQSARMPEILLALGRAYSLDEKPDKAHAALQKLIDGYPQTEAAAQARQLLDKP